MTPEGNIEMKNGKPVLEFVAVMRLDNQMWAFPGVSDLLLFGIDFKFMDFYKQCTC